MPSELLDAALEALATAEAALLGRAGTPRHFRRVGATLLDPADVTLDPSDFADRAIRDALTHDGPGTTDDRGHGADDHGHGVDDRGGDGSGGGGGGGGRGRGGDLELALASSVVRLGKLASVDRLKVRSYLVVDGQLRSLKVWSGEVAVATGRREVDVRTQIAGVDGYRTPPILDHGEDGSTAFLLEPVVRGQHPTSGDQRVAMAADLADALSSGYAATSRGDRPLSSITHPRFPARVDEVLADDALPWPDDVGARSSVRRRVAKLVAKDRSLPVAITHGDLVASNVIRDDDGRHHLVDWEHGRRGSPAFDLLKLVLASGDEQAALAAVTPHLESFGGRGLRRYRTGEQLALGVAQTLSWAPAARDRAVRAGRADRFDDEHRQRVRWLVRWLDA